MRHLNQVIHHNYALLHSNFSRFLSALNKDDGMKFWDLFVCNVTTFFMVKKFALKINIKLFTLKSCYYVINKVLQ